MAGSRKGVPNRKRRLMLSARHAMEQAGYDPFESCIKQAMETDDPKILAACNRELMQYADAKLQSIIMKGDPDAPVVLNLNMGGKED